MAIMEQMPDTGMSITGKWMNKQTGAIIEIRDSVIDGDNMILMTNLGQLSMDVFTRDYIQASDEYYDERGNVITDNNKIEEIKQQEKDSSELKFSSDFPEHLKQQLEKEKQIENTQQTQQSQVIIEQIPQTVQPSNFTYDDNTQSFKLLNKLFSKLDLHPHINISVECENFPTNELKMLKDFYDVDMEDIALYLSKTMFNNDELMNSIQEFLSDKI